ncbi:hypothetical protein M2317_000669 [Microbacterium sp. ZKA21]|uniref:hypothetical protein n=1 Tax=Microbacterium sp. ZKA21 TaxID=3381694 RepID=UPI003D1B71DB
MSDDARQHVERVAGSRRARLTPAPGTDPSPDVAAKDAAASVPAKEQGPNDARLRQDVPPHY